MVTVKGTRGKRIGAEQAAPVVKSVTIESIKECREAQLREQIDEDLVAEYAGAMRAKVKFPAITTFEKDRVHYIGDGFHRFRAAQQVGKKRIQVEAWEARHDGVRDAILHAAGANSSHGLRRSNSDKRKAVLALLKDKEWREWSDRRIARQCAVSGRFVGSLRKELSANDSQIRKVERGGASYEMKVRLSDKSAEGTNKKRGRRARLKQLEGDLSKTSKKTVSSAGTPAGASSSKDALVEQIRSTGERLLRAKSEIDAAISDLRDSKALRKETLQLREYANGLGTIARLIKSKCTKQD